MVQSERNTISVQILFLTPVKTMLKLKWNLLLPLRSISKLQLLLYSLQNHTLSHSKNAAKTFLSIKQTEQKILINQMARLFPCVWRFKLTFCYKGHWNARICCNQSLCTVILSRILTIRGTPKEEWWHRVIPSFSLKKEDTYSCSDFQIFLFMHYFNSLLQKKNTIHHKSNIKTTLNHQR